MLWLCISQFNSLTVLEPSWTCPKQALVFTCLLYKSSENTVGKGEIAHNEQFLLFPQCILPFWITFCHIHKIWNCHLQTLSVWKSLKFVVGKELSCCCRHCRFRSNCPECAIWFSNNTVCNLHSWYGWNSIWAAFQLEYIQLIKVPIVSTHQWKGCTFLATLKSLSAMCPTKKVFV